MDDLIFKKMTGFFINTILPLFQLNIYVSLCPSNVSLLGPTGFTITYMPAPTTLQWTVTEKRKDISGTEGVCF